MTVWFCSTVPAVPPPNVTSEVVSHTMIYVAWEEIPLIDRNGIITIYEVLYVPLRGDLTNGSINTTNLSLVIMDLEEFAHYNISVRAYTSVGPGPFSVPIINRTEEHCKVTIGHIKL